MFRRRIEEPIGPTLADRVLKSGCERIAILGVNSGAGAGTVLSRLARDFQTRGRVPAVTSAASGPMVDDPSTWPGERTRLPAGILAATARGALDESEARVEFVRETGSRAAYGDVVVVRVLEDGALLLNGPEDAEGMAEVTAGLAAAADGPICLTGRWERRAFATPGVADGIVLTVGPDLSATPQRAAVAVRHHAEIASLPGCDDMIRLAWQVAVSREQVVFAGDSGSVIDAFDAVVGEDPSRRMEALDASAIRAILHPGVLTDEFIIPLARREFRCTLVVEDTTRLGVAPIYYRSWLKGGGRFRVVDRSRLLAIATNPTSTHGEDAGAADFRGLVAESVPGVPVHDVVLESSAPVKRSGWRPW